MEAFADPGRVKALRIAWELARDDLGIRVTTEGAYLVDPSGESHPLVAIIPDFSSTMHIFERYQPLLAGVIRERGQGFTELGSGYDRYDRATFIEVLNDWGWTGTGSPPTWYTGPDDT